MATVATAVDLSPILTPLLQIAGTVLTGIASWAVYKLGNLLHIGAQTALKQAILDGIVRGISFAENKLGTLVASGVSVDIHNQVAAEALNYVVSKFGGTMSALGYTEQTISDLILAKLPKAPAA